MRACSATMALLVVLTLTACGETKPAAESATTNEPAATKTAATASVSAPTTSAITRVDASGFKLSDYLPPLDGGKIELATPDGWKPAPRDSKYVVRFVEAASAGLPVIEVLAEDKNLGGLNNVTEANVADFTAAVAKDLEASGTAVIEPPIPMVIGSVPCARYVSVLKLKIGGGTLPVERQTLALLHAGRLYKINLLVDVEKLLKSRDAAYAVCAGVRFLEAAPPAATE